MTDSEAMPEREVEEQMMLVIREPNLQDVVARFADIGLGDAIGGVLGQVPLVGSLFKILRGAATIRDAAFVKKVALFLHEVSRATPEERAAFVSGLDTEPSRREMGETLLLVLERLDHMAKPELIAKVLCELAAGRISRDEFDAMCFVIDRLRVPQLNALCGYARGLEPDPLTLQAFAYAGVAAVEARGIVGNVELRYKLDRRGRTLAEILERRGT